MGKKGILMIIAAIVVIVVFAVVGVHSAYKSGIRDGYQNTWLPQVINQVREEGLRQGGRIDYEGEV